MGTIYDIPQWLSTGDNSLSCWRVLWTFPSDPQDLVAPGATEDAFLYGENAEQVRLILSDLFDQVDGPVIRISRWQGLMMKLMLAT
ncbi:hypothetical protein GQ53DRAFT_546594 [Thozetella sp. PMI_491]|nr:hypothetical protein GQ53DRAFT_546594 [Thozetella sp. PMI_491]